MTCPFDPAERPVDPGPRCEFCHRPMAQPHATDIWRNGRRVRVRVCGPACATNLQMGSEG